jgi:hypothetical protein
MVATTRRSLASFGVDALAIDHREDGPHECRVVKHKRPPGRPPAGGYPAHDCGKAGCTVTECPPHECRPLSNATISKLHFIMRGALAAAVRWDWIPSNQFPLQDRHFRASTTRVASNHAKARG